MRSSVWGLGVPLLVGCAASPERPRVANTEDPLTWTVDEPGPYGGAWRGWEVSYTPAGQEEERTFGLNLWYPTEDETGEPVHYMGVFEDPLALGNAAAAPPVHDGRYPVMVHSHGFQGWGGPERTWPGTSPPTGGWWWHPTTSGTPSSTTSTRWRQPTTSTSRRT